MANTFSGRDRRLMQQTARNLRAIVSRDIRAENPKITTTLSTRKLIGESSLDDGRHLYFDLLGIPTRIDQYASILASCLEEKLQQKGA